MSGATMKISKMWLNEESNAHKKASWESYPYSEKVNFNPV